MHNLIFMMNNCSSYHVPLRMLTSSYYTPRNEVEGGYTGFTLFVRPSVRLSVCLSVRPSVRPWVGVRMITLILFSGFKFFFYIYHLGQDLAWDWISASYLIKYAHTGRSCDLLIFGVPEVNFLVRAFQFGMKGVLSRIPDISPEFCWIPMFVFFLHFYVFLNWPTPSVGGRSCDLLIFGIHEVNFSFLLGMLLRGVFSERAF